MWPFFYFQERPHDCFAKYMHSVHNGHLEFLVACNFNYSAPFHADLIILGLFCYQDEAQHKLEECYLVYCLGSVQPNGTNIEFSNLG